MTDTVFPCLGWREWVALPALGIERIKAKVDTGARTSTLHAFYVKVFEEEGRQRVRFKVHPVQRDTSHEVECVADVHDIRWVSDSGGHREQRVVILTPLRLGDSVADVEMTLTDRDTMQFRMLLGRSAVAGRFIVDPQKSYLTGRPPRKKKKKRHDPAPHKQECV